MQDPRPKGKGGQGLYLRSLLEAAPSPFLSHVIQIARTSLSLYQSQSQQQRSFSTQSSLSAPTPSRAESYLYCSSSNALPLHNIQHSLDLKKYFQNDWMNSHPNQKKPKRLISTLQDRQLRQIELTPPWKRRCCSLCPLQTPCLFILLQIFILTYFKSKKTS